MNTSEQTKIVYMGGLVYLATEKTGLVTSYKSLEQLGSITPSQQLERIARQNSGFKGVRV